MHLLFLSEVSTFSIQSSETWLMNKGENLECLVRSLQMLENKVQSFTERYENYMNQQFESQLHNTKHGNILWKNGVHSFIRVSETMWVYKKRSTEVVLWIQLFAMRHSAVSSLIGHHTVQSS